MSHHRTIDELPVREKMNSRNKEDKQPKRETKQNTMNDKRTMKGPMLWYRNAI